MIFEQNDTKFAPMNCPVHKSFKYAIIHFILTNFQFNSINSDNHISVKFFFLFVVAMCIHCRKKNLCCFSHPRAFPFHSRKISLSFEFSFSSLSLSFLTAIKNYSLIGKIFFLIQLLLVRVSRLHEF